jgi:anti-sigma factor RsiW
MTHPEDQLASYVDGSLTPEERSVVDAHLTSCDACREEVALATTASRSLRALPRTVGTPPEVGRDAIDGAAARPPGSPTPASPDDWSSEAPPAAAPDHPRWYRWAGAAAGAAAVILALALAIPALNGGDDGTSGTLAAEDASGGTASMAEAAAPDIERIAGNLGPTDLPALAEPVKAAVPNGAVSAAPPTAEADEGGQDAEGPGDPALSEPTSSPAADRRAEAVVCLRSAFPAVTGPPLRLVELRFQKTLAYGGVFFVPGGTETEFGTFEFDVLEVVVASRADCTLLSAAPVRP